MICSSDRTPKNLSHTDRHYLKIVESCLGTCKDKDYENRMTKLFTNPIFPVNIEESKCHLKK